MANERLDELLDQAPPEGLLGKLKMLPKLAQLGKMFPKKVSSAPCQEVVWEGDDVDLSKIPVLTTWPDDGGPETPPAPALVGPTPDPLRAPAYVIAASAGTVFAAVLPPQLPVLSTVITLAVTVLIPVLGSVARGSTSEPAAPTPGRDSPATVVIPLTYVALRAGA